MTCGVGRRVPMHPDKMLSTVEWATLQNKVLQHRSYYLTQAPAIQWENDAFHKHLISQHRLQSIKYFWNRVMGVMKEYFMQCVLACTTVPTYIPASPQSPGWAQFRNMQITNNFDQNLFHWNSFKVELSSEMAVLIATETKHGSSVRYITLQCVQSSSLALGVAG